MNREYPGNVALLSLRLHLRLSRPTICVFPSIHSRFDSYPTLLDRLRFRHSSSLSTRKNKSPSFRALKRASPLSLLFFPPPFYRLREIDAISGIVHRPPRYQFAFRRYILPSKLRVIIDKRRRFCYPNPNEFFFTPARIEVVVFHLDFFISCSLDIDKRERV